MKQRLRQLYDEHSRKYDIGPGELIQILREHLSRPLWLFDEFAQVLPVKAYSFLEFCLVFYAFNRMSAQNPSLDILQELNFDVPIRFKGAKDDEALARTSLDYNLRYRDNSEQDQMKGNEASLNPETTADRINVISFSLQQVQSVKPIKGARQPILQQLRRPGPQMPELQQSIIIHHDRSETLEQIEEPLLFANSSVMSQSLEESQYIYDR